MYPHISTHYLSISRVLSDNHSSDISIYVLRCYYYIDWYDISTKSSVLGDHFFIIPAAGAAIVAMWGCLAEIQAVAQWHSKVGGATWIGVQEPAGSQKNYDSDTLW